MTQNLYSWFSLILFAVFSLSVANGQEDLTGIKCVVRGDHAATPDASVKYKDGKVYFCCEGCATEFREDVKLKDRARHTLKANHQLVLTGQYVQTSCPMSAGLIDENLIAEVGGTKIGFCCQDCYDKVRNAKDLEAKAELVFSDSAFKKAFQKHQPEIDLTNVKCIVMPNRNVAANQSVDYKNGKIYFCCKRCARKFAGRPDEFATRANRQLVATGQYIQTGCPVTAGEVDDEESSDVGGVTVKFCCDECKDKIDNANSDEDRAELVFGEKSFRGAFSKK